MTLYSPGGLNLADTTAPLILAYDDSGTKDVVFAVSTGGDLTITPDGGDIELAAAVAITLTLAVAGIATFDGGLDGVLGGVTPAAGSFTALEASGAGGVVSNTALGNQALPSNTSGDSNTAIGNQALDANTTGSDNIAVGRKALLLNVTGANNIAVGVSALHNTTGSYNTAVGHTALTFNTTGSRNVAIGASAGSRSTNLSDRLYIDNWDRGSQAADDMSSLIYGVFDTLVTNQTLRINAALT